MRNLEALMHKPDPAKRGREFTRLALVMAATNGRVRDAAELAEARYGGASLPARVLREAVPGGTIEASPGWGSELTHAYMGAAAEFFALAAEASIPGRIGLRRVPMNTAINAIGTGAEATWVSQHAAKPLTEISFDLTSLPPLKLAAVAIISAELARLSSPEAEASVRDDMVRAVAAKLDTSFLDTSNSGTSDTEPASVTNGLAAVSATGTLADDLRALVAASSGDLAQSWFIAQPQTFAAIAATLGTDRLGLRGGALLGAPAAATRHAPANALILIDPSGVAYASEGGSISVARHATVDVNAGGEGGASLVDLWQKNLVGIRAERLANWSTPRAGSVAILTGLSFAGGA